MTQHKDAEQPITAGLPQPPLGTPRKRRGRRPRRKRQPSPYGAILGEIFDEYDIDQEQVRRLSGYGSKNSITMLLYGDEQHPQQKYHPAILLALRTLGVPEHKCAALDAVFQARPRVHSAKKPHATPPTPPALADSHPGAVELWEGFAPATLTAPVDLAELQGLEDLDERTAKAQAFNYLCGELYPDHVVVSEKRIVRMLQRRHERIAQLEAQNRILGAACTDIAERCQTLQGERDHFQHAWMDERRALQAEHDRAQHEWQRRYHIVEAERDAVRRQREQERHVRRAHDTRGEEALAEARRPPEGTSRPSGLYLVLALSCLLLISGNAIDQYSTYSIIATPPGHIIVLTRVDPIGWVYGPAIQQALGIIGGAVLLMLAIVAGYLWRAQHLVMRATGGFVCVTWLVIAAGPVKYVNFLPWTVLMWIATCALYTMPLALLLWSRMGSGHSMLSDRQASIHPGLLLCVVIQIGCGSVLLHDTSWPLIAYVDPCMLAAAVGFIMELGGSVMVSRALMLVGNFLTGCGSGGAIATFILSVTGPPKNFDQAVLCALLAVGTALIGQLVVPLGSRSSPALVLDPDAVPGQAVAAS